MPRQELKRKRAMAIELHRTAGITGDDEGRLALECPYCGVYANMSPQAVPDADKVIETQPKHVGLVYQCDACRAPVFLRFAVKKISSDSVELNRNFVELERPKERFAFSYLPKHTEVLFREALSCYSGNNFNAFASMCRRAASSAFEALGDNGKLHAFEEVVVAQNIAGIDDDNFAPIKTVLFDVGEEEDLPLMNRFQAGIMLEIMKDLFYQLFVRRGKLTRALKVRRFFVQEADGDFASSA
ncbi:MAG: hypothetical protein HKN77_10000 [Woeseiaceae bacterium]|nr:hypothetical protein [Woeseiaceae bacterium]